jgi:hypothetical protein
MLSQGLHRYGIDPTRLILSVVALGALAVSSAAQAVPMISLEATYAGATAPISVTGVSGTTISLVVDGFDGITTGTLTAKLTLKGYGPLISLSGGQLDSDNGTPTPLIIEVSAYNLTKPVEGVISDSDTFNFQSSSSATYASYYSPNNGVFAEQYLVTANNFTGSSANPTSQSYSYISPLAVTGSLYSITQEFDVTAVPGGAPQVSSNLTDVPEPGAAGLLSAGLLALVVSRPLSTRLRR